MVIHPEQRLFQEGRKMPFLSCLGILLAVIHALQSIPITYPYSIVHSSQSAAQTPLEFLNLTGHPSSENYFHSNTKILFSLLLFQEYTMIFFLQRPQGEIL